MADPREDAMGYPKLDIKAARALNPRTQTIRIANIMGGHSPMSHFAGKDQFESSIGIDPFDTIVEGVGGNVPSRAFMPASGLLRPSGFNTVAGVFTNAGSIPLWLRGEPKNGAIYAYTSTGSAYTSNDSAANFTALSDKGLTDSGAGLEYYDNYMYFATSTDIVRYGPLNGVPTFNGAYWTGTLGKAALTNTTYPSLANGALPNHFLHRHSDGKLYIADVVGNQGVLHVISTSKTTVEGDTDNGSTYQKLTFGYGLWPTAIESYGSQLVISLVEGASTTVYPGAQRAKIAFWDTTSQNFNSITWTEFPDELVSAIKNVDGTLLFASGGQAQYGFKISKYVGGNSFATVTEFPSGLPPYPGGMDGDSDRLFIATSSYHPTVTTGSFLGVMEISSINSRPAVFNVGNVNGSSTTAPALFLSRKGGGGLVSRKGIIIGHGIFTSGQFASSHLDTETPDYSLYTRRWLSQKYTIGQPFKITKIRIPFAQAMAANMSVTPFIIADDYTSTTQLTTMDNTAYPGVKQVVIRPNNLVGQHNFQLELQWTGSALCVVNLPITIEYELIPD